MTRITQRMKRSGRIFRFAAALTISAAGAAYVLAPPRSAAGLWEADWPAIVWGVLMFAGGIITSMGLRTRILNVEQYGMLMTAVSTGMLVINQTLLMLYPPITPTRAGGTLILLGFLSFATARYFELAADIRSAKLAEEKIGEA